MSSLQIIQLLKHYHRLQRYVDTSKKLQSEMYEEHF